MPAVAALNDSEIVVLGGAGVDDDDEIADLGDAIVIDVSQPDEPQAQKVVRNYAGLVQFSCENNTCGRVAENCVVALGVNDE